MTLIDFEPTLLLPAKFHLDRYTVSPLRDEKPKNRSVSKNNTEVTKNKNTHL